MANYQVAFFTSTSNPPPPPGTIHSAYYDESNSTWVPREQGQVPQLSLTMGPNADGSILLTLYTEVVKPATLPPYYQGIPGLKQIFPTFIEAAVSGTPPFKGSGGGTFIEISGISNPSPGSPDGVIIVVADNGTTYQTSDPEIVNS